MTDAELIARVRELENLAALTSYPDAYTAYAGQMRALAPQLASALEQSLAREAKLRSALEMYANLGFTCLQCDNSTRHDLGYDARAALGINPTTRVE